MNEAPTPAGPEQPAATAARQPAVARRLRALWQDALSLIRSRAFLGPLAVLLAVDAVLVLFHVLYVLNDMELLAGGSFFESQRLLLSEDHGYGEFWGYAKSAVIVAAFLVHWRRARAPLFAALGFTFAVVVLDDSLMLHEVLGNRLSHALALEPVLGLKGQDQGELLVWSALGTAIVAALVAGFWLSAGRVRTIGTIFLGLLGALVFFAVVVDMLHILLNDVFRGAYRVWPLIEDGGELAVLSLTCAAALALRGQRARRRPDFPAAHDSHRETTSQATAADRGPVA